MNNRFKILLLERNIRMQAAESHVKGYRFAVSLTLISMVVMIFLFTVQAQNPHPPKFNLVPAADAIATCLPNASARVVVTSRDDIRGSRDDVKGVDTLDLRAEGLPANTRFAVFLTELAEPPFGAAQYIGDFTTSASGRASLRVDTIIDEAFSSAVLAGSRVRKELNHVVIWFADPAADDFCFATGTGPVTPFDGDGEAGAAGWSSRNFGAGAPLP
jgi:hypothetical protein